MESSCTRFTASEGGARLAACAGTKNILVTEHTSFISTSVLIEHAYKIRGLLSSGRQRSVYVTRASRIECTAHELTILTDLAVSKAKLFNDVGDWKEELEKKEVLVCTSEVIKTILEEGLLIIPKINVLIIDSCHLIFKDQNLQYVMKLYKNYNANNRPRILALTYPLFTAPKDANETEEQTDTDTSTDKHVIDESTEIEIDSNNTDVDKQDIGDKGTTDKEILTATDNKQISIDNENKEITDTDNEINNKDRVSRVRSDNLDDFEMYEKLEWKFAELEEALCCEMDLAEDIDGGKRLSATATKPKELIIEYSPRSPDEDLPEAYIELEKYMKDAVYNALDFIEEHRYDPTEIYGEELYEEFKNIPDPTIEPKEIFDEFLYVLEQLGPYAADKAAISLLTKLEKLKIKVPYERHFLLLCLCTTVFVKIRCYADALFSKYTSDWDKIVTFSTPKVSRLAEILEQFNPPERSMNLKNISENESKNKIEDQDKLNGESIKNSQKTKDELLNDLDKCDFITLSNKIEDRVNTFEANLKDLEFDIENVESKNNLTRNSETVNISEKCDADSVNILNSENNDNVDNKLDNGPEKHSGNNNSDIKNSVSDIKIFGRRSGQRTRGRGRVQRNNAAKLLQLQQNPDALCGIIFMREALMAKIMFMMIVDMSRSRPSLSFLCAQYCATEGSGQKEGKKQEEVLKKFRMHECNLLLATSVLEEGIDLPRCNLVVRWDVPPSYRSHGLCRGRARAPRASVTLLAEAEAHSETLVHNLAVYRELDQIITRKCGCGIQDEPPIQEENHADTLASLVKSYTPLEMKSRINDKENQGNHTNISEDVENDTEIINKDIENYENCVELDIEENFNDIIVVENVNKEMSPESNIDDENALNVLTSRNFADEEQINDSNSVGIKLCTDEAKDEQITTILSNNIENHIANEYITSNEFENETDINNEVSKEFDGELEEELTNNEVDNKHKENCNNILDFRENNIKYEFKVGDKKNEEIASVDLNSAIALINRYCGKLPSDTFTRLTPQCWTERVRLPDRTGRETTAYICTLRMPLNCPVKYNIVGHPMPTRVLARRMVALQACRILHKSGELDDHLMPIGKENFRATELDNNLPQEAPDSDCARPGTTKRRQYYFKRTAWAFTDCQAVIDSTDEDIEKKPSLDGNPDSCKDSPNALHSIACRLWCALPERYNTRGRRLHAPQRARHALALLTARRRPLHLQIPAFPVYTRSGEVRVSVEPAPEADVRLCPRRARLIRRFMRFVFSDVLRVRRRGMKLQAEGSTHNNYYIVPTIKKTRADGTSWLDIDWSFLEQIYKHTEEKKAMEIEKPMIWEEEGDRKKDKHEKLKKSINPLLKPGEVFVFDAEKYKEAVVTPWYRNQDQPQFFLVAEICWNLTPDSAFPSAQHTSFRSYYKAKYGATLTQSDQPLLDVDHTSARLNLLTPRYVNRKGVALPVSSERTRRAKRDRLDQKQILVPELCRVHPFAAPLWFATVALPCVLYRINALLIADEIRRSVAIDVGLGVPRVDQTTCPGFQWPPLDFGWSLAEVLSTDSDKGENKKEDDDPNNDEKENESKSKEENDSKEHQEEEMEDEKDVKEKTINDILQEKEDAERGFEIGTWSNDMASSLPETEYDDLMSPLPPNVTFCTSSSGGANWSEPLEKPKSQYSPGRAYSVADSDCSYMSSDFDTDDSDISDESDDDTDTTGFCSSKNSNAAMGVRIEYKTAHEAEAVDLERRKPIAPAPQPDALDDERDLIAFKTILRGGDPPDEYLQKFRKSVEKHERDIIENKLLIAKDKKIEYLLPESTRDNIDKAKNIVNKSTNEKQNDNSNTNENNTKETHNEIEEVCNDIINRNDERKQTDNLANSVETAAIVKNNDEIDTNIELNNKLTIQDTTEVDDHNIDKGFIQKVSSELKNICIVENNDTVRENSNESNENCARTMNEPETVNNDKNQNGIKSERRKPNIEELFPCGDKIEFENGQITLESIERNKRQLLHDLKKRLSDEEIKKMNCFSMKDIDIDSDSYVNEKIANVGFDSKEKYEKLVNSWGEKDFKPYYLDGKDRNGKEFDFDAQPNLEGHPGPSPSVILQALTMSNANDGINLERLETIGDSFLKFAITAYLYCAHPAVHEGKLSHMRSKQVSNLNLYRLGRNKRLGARMIASKFEPHDNWLPPCHKPPPTLQPNTADTNDATKEAPVDSAGCFIPYNLITQHSIPDKSIADCVEALIGAYLLECGPRGALLFMSWLGIRVLPRHAPALRPRHPAAAPRPAPPHTRCGDCTLPPQQSKPMEPLSSDSSCDEEEQTDPELGPPEPDWSWPGRPVGSLRPYQDKNGKWIQPIFGELKAPPSPLLRYIEDPEGELEQMLSGYDALERTLQYRFRDRSLLLQALTHASHQKNRLTDCYQRLEFLGDAILDYLITRHLFEDPRRHSPGALTDLRSALVNNTIFATLAARHGFHKYFRHMSPGLNEVLTKYVKIQEENGHSISEEHYLIQEDEMEQAEDVEVPKALGDLFESVAGAIFLDSGMSLACVWRSAGALLGAELDAFSAAAPKSPVRELLEAEPDTAKFGKPERLADGRRVRVCVEVFGRGAFKGIGRNYRIAKGTAARCALRHLKIHRPR